MILFSDGLVKKLNELERTADMYNGLMEHTRKLIKGFFDLSQSHRGLIPFTLISQRRFFTGSCGMFASWCCSISAFGDVFASIGVREPQPNASEAFTQFGEAHREIERYAVKMLKTVKPVRLRICPRNLTTPHKSVHLSLI